MADRDNTTNSSSKDPACERCEMQEIPPANMCSSSEETESPREGINREPRRNRPPSKHGLFIFGSYLLVVGTLVLCVLSQLKLQSEIDSLRKDLSDFKGITSNDLQMINKTTTAGILDAYENLQYLDGTGMNGILQIEKKLHFLKKTTEDGLQIINITISNDIASLEKNLRNIQRTAANDLQILNASTANGLLKVKEDIHVYNRATANDLRILNATTADEIKDIKQMLSNFSRTSTEDNTHLKECLSNFTRTSVDALLKVKEDLHFYNRATENEFMSLKKNLSNIQQTTAKDLQIINVTTANEISSLKTSLSNISWTTANGLTTFNETTANGIAHLNEILRNINRTTVNEITDIKQTLSNFSKISAEDNTHLKESLSNFTRTSADEIQSVKKNLRNMQRTAANDIQILNVSTTNALLKVKEDLHFNNRATENEFMSLKKNLSNIHQTTAIDLRIINVTTANEISSLKTSLSNISWTTANGLTTINETTANGIAHLNEILRNLNRTTVNEITDIKQTLSNFSRISAEDNTHLKESLSNFTRTSADAVLRVEKDLHFYKRAAGNEISILKTNLSNISWTIANDLQVINVTAANDLNKSLCYSQIEQDIANNTEKIEGLKRFANIVPRKLRDIKQRLNEIEATTQSGVIEVDEVRHNMMSERAVVSSCESAGCHTVTPTYEMPDRYIDELIARSSSCKQFIKIKCQGVRINRDEHFTYWISRTGEKMYNWGTAKSNYCQCGLNDTCISNSYKCNCDQNSGSVVTSDEGYLTDKSKLPLREIRIGDMGSSDERAWLTIGKLECVGLSVPIKVRLSSGGSNYGRVEILHGGTWGTVCDDGWGWNEANVICKMLGFYHANSFDIESGAGSGRIWLDDVSCTGSESSIIFCNKNSWGHHNCGHSEDVGVRCSNDAAVRLQGGSSHSGRVEIFHNGVWGTICDDDWDLNDAHVVCRMLGFRRASDTRSFGRGAGSIWFDDVDCFGTESSILECVHSGFGVHDCDHDDDVAVACDS